MRWSMAAASSSANEGTQQVRFCRSPDGVRLAYASHGSGRRSWSSRAGSATSSTTGRARSGATSSMTSARSPPSSATTSAASGCPTGTSTTSRSRRGSATSRRSSTRPGLERFALLGMSGGSAVALAYAARHPERVTRLILYGMVCGEPVERTRPTTLAEEETYRSMIRAGWATDGPASSGACSPTSFIPDATEEQMRWFDDLQRMSTSPENAVAQPDRAPGGRRRRRCCRGSRRRRSCSRRSATGRRLRERASGSLRRDPGRPPRAAARAATTSCSPTSRRGRCSWTR